MVFDQAFYTSGENQLSRYKSGLGICASSSLETSFLDNCMIIGANFKPEVTEKTAKFVVYSDRFDAFVGIGISPRSAGKEARVNMLCHMLIPRERGAQNPEKYYLKYDFARNVEPGEITELKQIPPLEYHYKDILEENGLDEEKLAVFLQKIYPCIFQEQRIFIVFQGDKEEDYEKAAREITFLLSSLVPAPDGMEDLFRKRLSYGIYTTRNLSVVRIIYTKDAQLGGEDVNRFFWGSSPDPDETIPSFYRAIAKWVYEAAYNPENPDVCFQTIPKKLNEILACGISSNLQSVRIDEMYIQFLNWKLDNNGNVEDTEFDIDLVLKRSVRSKWYQNFLLKFLNQKEVPVFSERETLIKLWKEFLMPRVENNSFPEKDFKEAIKRTLERIQEMSMVGERKCYWESFQDIQNREEEFKLWILREWLIEGRVKKDIKIVKDLMMREIKAGNTSEGSRREGVEEFRRFCSVFSLLGTEDKFRKMLVKNLQSLFWYKDTEVAYRNILTEGMKECGCQDVWKIQIKEEFKAKIKKRESYKEKIMFALNFMDPQKGRQYDSLFTVYITEFFNAIKEGDKEDVADFLERIQIFWENSKEYIADKEVTYNWDSLLKKWELENAEIENLAGERIDLLGKSNLEVWICCIIEKITEIIENEKFDIVISMEWFQRLAENASVIWEFCQKESLEEKYKVLCSKIAVVMSSPCISLENKRQCQLLYWASVFNRGETSFCLLEMIEKITPDRLTEIQEFFREPKQMRLLEEIISWEKNEENRKNTINVLAEKLERSRKEQSGFTKDLVEWTAGEDKKSTGYEMWEDIVNFLEIAEQMDMKEPESSPVEDDWLEITKTLLCRFDKSIFNISDINIKIDADKLLERYGQVMEKTYESIMNDYEEKLKNLIDMKEELEKEIKELKKGEKKELEDKIRLIVKKEIEEIRREPEQSSNTPFAKRP